MDNKQEFKIVLGVASLGIPSVKFVSSLIQTVLGNIFHRFCLIEGALLPFIRNLIIKKIYENDPDFTHVMFIDDDMCNFNSQDILNLIQANKPIISALMLMRKPPYLIVNSFKQDEPIDEYIDKKEIRQVKQTGLGFTLIKKEVFDAVQENTIGDPIWFTTDRSERNSFEVEIDDFIRSKHKEYQTDHLTGIIKKAVVMGQQSHIGTMITGEDIGFCVKAKRLGFDSWIHCGVPVGHIGNQVFDIRSIPGTPGIEEQKLKLVGVN